MMSNLIIAGNALWAFAKLGQSPSAGLLAAAAPRLTALLPNATPQNIANWLLPYVIFKVQPLAQLLDGIVAVLQASPEVRPNPVYRYIMKLVVVALPACCCPDAHCTTLLAALSEAV